MQVWRSIAVAGAYCFDALRAGVGVLSVAVGLLVSGFGFLVEGFRQVVGLAKALPDSIRPDWVEDLAGATEAFEGATFAFGDNLIKQGKDWATQFGQTPKVVGEWFDQRKNHAPNPQAPPAWGQVASAPPPTAQYSPVAALLKDSKEEYSVRARFETNALLNPKKIDQQQLDEQKKANAILNDIKNGITTIRLPVFGVV